jgi:O-antigen/teichoic acid export membrane protein
MGLAFIPLYIRYLGIESYALIGLFAMLNSWLSLLDMGMTPTLNREMARFTSGSHTAESIRDLLRSIEIITIGIAILIACSVGLSADWLASSWLKADSLPVPAVAQAFCIIGLVTALRFVETIYRSSIVGLQRQVFLNAINSSMATLRGLGAVGILAWVSPTIQAFFFWQGFVSVLNLAVFVTATYRCLPKANRPARFSSAVLRGVWRFASGMMCITFLSLLLTQVDKILLSKLLILTDYGYYTLAVAVASALYMLINPITQAWYPRLNQLHAANNQIGLIRAYHQGAQLVTVIVGSVALVLIAFSEIFLRLWTQDAAIATHASLLLSLLVLGNLLNGLMWIPYQTQLVHGWTSLAVRINIVAVIVIVPAILWVTPRYGAVGAAWVWVGLNAGYLLIGAHFMYRRVLTTEKWRWYQQDVLQPLLAGTVAVAALRLLIPVSDKMSVQLATLAIAFLATLVSSVLSVETSRKSMRFLLESLISRKQNKLKESI